MNKTEGNSEFRGAFNRAMDVVGNSAPAKFVKEQALRIESVKKGEELREAIKTVSAERGLSPDEVEKFLSNEKPKGLELSDAVTSGILLVLHFTLLSILNYEGASSPGDTQISLELHAVLQSFNNSSVNAAESPALRDHLPYLFLNAAIIYAGGKAMVQKIIKKVLGTGKLLELQEQVIDKKAEGELPIKMDEGHTAIFSGDGDILATLLRKIKDSGQASEYANKRITTDIWHRFNQEDIDEVFQALDRGDFASAGEALILPVKKEHMFLAPQDGGHDMTLDEIEGLINVLNDYCDDRDLKRKKIIVVGREGYSETHGKTVYPASGEKERSVFTRTLGSLSEKRDTKNDIAGLEVIDPTKLVMEEILKLADGKTIAFHATTESERIYEEEFESALRAMNYAPKNDTVVTVYYNVSDVPTSVSVVPGDSIAVILNPAQKLSFTKKGIPALVVPEIVNGVLSDEVEKT